MPWVLKMTVSEDGEERDQEDDVDVDGMGNPFSDDEDSEEDSEY